MRPRSQAGDPFYLGPGLPLLRDDVTGQCRRSNGEGGEEALEFLAHLARLDGIVHADRHDVLCQPGMRAAAVASQIAWVTDSATSTSAVPTWAP